ncbi:MAG: guanylate kinase [Candidatus Omnitrophica bacterium]|nr:guanylate kinase [Candidatus Omnitrophota bacterium]
MIRRRKQGLLIVISAPSGCGKTTIVNRLVERNPNLHRSVSVTTREPRRGEHHGVDYWFVSESEFLKRKREGDFLEWARVFDHYYGTPLRATREALAAGRDVILAIDIQGARKIRKLLKALYVFIMPPSRVELEKRLRARKSDSKREIEKRLDQARTEMECAKDYDYIVTNRHLEESIDALETIVSEAHLRRPLRTRVRRRGAEVSQK